MKLSNLVFKALVSVVLCSTVALADNVSDLMGLGVKPEVAAKLEAQYSTGLTTSELPATNNAIDLGSASKQWRNIYSVLATFSGKATLTGGAVYPAALFETVAAGTSAQGDGPLAAGKFIHFVTGFDETKVVTLPACAAANIGETHFILNATTNKFAKVFPASGGTINALAANAAYTQGVTGQGGKTVFCYCQAANQWYCA